MSAFHRLCGREPTTDLSQIELQHVRALHWPASKSKLLVLPFPLCAVRASLNIPLVQMVHHAGRCMYLAHALQVRGGVQLTKREAGVTSAAHTDTLLSRRLLQLRLLSSTAPPVHQV